MHRFFNSIIESTIVSRTAEEPLGQGTLKQLLKPYSAYASNLNKNPKYQSVGEIAEDAVIAELLDNAFLEPEPRRVLIEHTRGWKRSAILLYVLLYYSRTSGRVLSLSDFQPFHVALHDFRADFTDDRDKACAEVPQFLSRTRVSHFITPAGITWLVEALEKRFTLTLCIDFLKRRDNFQILDFELLQFVQWHLLASASYRPWDDSEKVTPDEKDLIRLRRAAPTILQFIRDWDESDYGSSYEVKRVFAQFEVDGEARFST